MTDLVELKVAELLGLAQQAHHAYQSAELNGKRNEQWAAWYADFLGTNGLGDLIGKELDLDELAEFLEETDREYKTGRSQGRCNDFAARKFLDTFE